MVWTLLFPSLEDGLDKAAFSVIVAADAIVLDSSPLMLRSPKMDDSISAKQSSKAFVELDADRAS